MNEHPAQLPTLERLTDEFEEAMGRVERRRPRRRRARSLLLAALGLALLAPAAWAITTIVGAPGDRITTRINGYDRPTVVAAGQLAGTQWRIALKRCTADGVAAAALIGPYPETAGAAASRCSPKRRPPVAPAQASSSGVSLIYGIVPDRVRSITLLPGDPGTGARIAGRAIRVSPTRFPAAALSSGALPPGYRVFVTAARGSHSYSRAIARDSTGRVLSDCTRRECDHLARIQTRRPGA